MPLSTSNRVIVRDLGPEGIDKDYLWKMAYCPEHGLFTFQFSGATSANSVLRYALTHLDKSHVRDSVAVHVIYYHLHSDLEAEIAKIKLELNPVSAEGTSPERRRT